MFFWFITNYEDTFDKRLKQKLFFRYVPEKMEFITGLLKPILWIERKILLNQLPLSLEQVGEFVDLNSKYLTLKEFWEGVMKNIITSSNITLMDRKNILLSDKVKMEISRKKFLIMVSNNLPEYRTNILTIEPGTNVEVFFQILANNYQEDAHKIDFLNFFARYCHQDGFLDMGRTELYLQGQKYGIHLENCHQEMMIFLNTSGRSRVGVVEKFGISRVIQNGKATAVDINVEFHFMITVSEDSQIRPEKLVFIATKNDLNYLSPILNGYTNQATNSYSELATQLRLKA